MKVSPATCFVEAVRQVQWKGNGFITSADLAANQNFELVAALMAK